MCLQKGFTKCKSPGHKIFPFLLVEYSAAVVTLTRKQSNTLNICKPINTYELRSSPAWQKDNLPFINLRHASISRLGIVLKSLFSYSKNKKNQDRSKGMLKCVSEIQFDKNHFELLMRLNGYQVRKWAIASDIPFPSPGHTESWLLLETGLACLIGIAAKQPVMGVRLDM